MAAADAEIEENFELTMEDFRRSDALDRESLQEAKRRGDPIPKRVRKKRDQEALNARAWARYRESPEVREKKKKANAEYHRAHREELNARSAEWRKRNPERCKAYQRAYNEKHAEKIRQRSQAYYQKNKERYRAYYAKRKKEKLLSTSQDAPQI